ncbi:FAD-dependent oxidoreductase [Methanobacterium sp.]|uniref:FAD-dependent oxidoreductase n=1 Tax=Methanobacterium sp. TaxID=2164 RepID=UPI003C7610D3
MKVVIIGSGAGGLTAASNIRKYSDETEITVITRENQVAYSQCAIPYVIGGEIESFDEIVMHTPEYYGEHGINIITDSEVFEVVSSEKFVKYRSNNPENRNKNEHGDILYYDYLVIATGGSPFIPPVEGTGLKGVFKVRTIEDGAKIKKWAEHSKKAVVVGAGAIGLELGYGLKQLGIDVSVTEMVPQILPRSLDPDMALKVQDYLESLGVDIVLEKALNEIIGSVQAEEVIVGEEHIYADLVILSTGIRPSIELAKQAGCIIGNMGVTVNERMETSIPCIYSVGDCVEVYDGITGEKTVSPFGTTAVRQGKVAAKNIIGRDAVFRPVLNSVVSVIGELEIGAVGLTETSAKLNNIDVVIGRSKALTKARYYPGCKPIDIKILCSPDGKILGCQIIAKETVAERVDTMALAIAKGVNCAELTEMEFSYAPPVSMVVDPIVLAAENVLEKINTKK